MALHPPAAPPVDEASHPVVPARLVPTRERLLNEASRLFAARGYDGVAVDEIVAAAAANKRMVYHYFGSKEALYIAVLERAFAGLTASEERLFQPSGGDARHVLANLVAVYFRFLQGHPEFVRLLLWENLQGGGRFLRAGQAVSRSPMLRHLQDLIEQGEAEGAFRPGLDPQSLLVSLVGLCLIYFSNRHTLSHTIGIDLADPAVIDRGIETTKALVLHGVCRPVATDAAAGSRPPEPA